MTLHAYTARISYSGPDRLDVTRKSAGPEGIVFAPSWKILRPMLELRCARGASLAAWSQYVEDYTAEMRISYREHRAVWDAVLARDEITLVCYCSDAKHCHRSVLAGILGKLGATVCGERVEPRDAWLREKLDGLDDRQLDAFADLLDAELEMRRGRLP